MTRGPVPKANAARRNKQPEKMKLVASTRPRGPELPKNVLPYVKGTKRRQTWHPMTKKWWAALRRSPQANLMTTSMDWQFMLDTALMHHRMWTTGNFDLAAELRQRQAKFGFTPEDRIRMRVEVVDPSGAEGGTAPGVTGTVTSIQDRRNRMTGGA